MLLITCLVVLLAFLAPGTRSMAGVHFAQQLALMHSSAS
jgi:hypothetical protein